jgi:DMSO/TMAO reductase YedYZ molybdopterin-dependent catalytic subunit
MTAPQPITVETEPYNAETPLAALADFLTPAAAFYVRNHFAQPLLDPASWRLQVAGLVAQPLALTLAELRGFGERTLTVALECAGNGRKALNREVEGTPWGFGAAGTASFAGVPLRVVLDRADVQTGAQELVFAGADSGQVAPGRQEQYARSLPLAVAHHTDTLLAWAMNDEPLTRAHGAPVRLVVPGWYGMASVKWLTEITARATAFTGYFQAERYVYVDEDGSPNHGAPDRVPVTTMRVRSVIASPAAGERLPLGPIEIRGSAWAGGTSVAHVEISYDAGLGWHRAELSPPPSAHGAASWRYRWYPEAPGEYVLMARAGDTAGRCQPLRPAWNHFGYGNNVVQRVLVTIEG